MASYDVTRHPYGAIGAQRSETWVKVVAPPNQQYFALNADPTRWPVNCGIGIKPSGPAGVGVTQGDRIKT